MSKLCKKCGKSIPKIIYLNNKGELRPVENTYNECIKCGYREGWKFEF